MLTLETAKAYVANIFKDYAATYTVIDAKEGDLDGDRVVFVAFTENGVECEFVVWQQSDGSLYGEW